MSLIEYKGYRISVSASEQSWGFAFGEWVGSYCVWQKGNPVPIEGTMDGYRPSAYEAETRALTAVKSAIDDAIARSGLQLRSTLVKLERQLLI